MKIFQATVLSHAAAFEAAVEEKFSGNSLKVNDSVWLIAGSGTAQEICGQLGMPTIMGQPSPFSAMVVGVSGYYGYVATNIWEWIASKQAQDA